MKKSKLAIGIALHLISGIIGALIWAFAKDSVKMAKDSKESFIAVLVLACVPAVIIFALWFFRCVKALATIGGKCPSMWAPFLFGAAFACVIAVLISALFFQKAIVYGIITAVVTLIASFASYFIAKV